MTDFWGPRTEAELQTAIDQGLVRESHVFDVKKQPPPPEKNRDIAIDLANFAVDGGRILYGVHQPNFSGPTTLAPFDVSGLSERLDQIALGGSIDPPLRIRCVDIPSDTNPGRGYLLVVVPRSPQAPHMVDGRYRYRSDRTNSVPSDAEVRRIMGERTGGLTDIAGLLRDEVERDPTDGSLRTQGHLLIIAQPMHASRDLLAASIGSQNWRSWLNGAFREKVRSASTDQLHPDLFFHAGNLTPRPHCWAVSTYEIGPGRSIRPNGRHPAQEDNLLDLEVRDDGGLRLFCGRASYSADDHRPVTFLSLIVMLTRRVVRAAAAIAEKTDFLGDWGFGIAIRGIGQSVLGPWPGEDSTFVADYDEITTCSVDQVEDAPDEIARLLLASFSRGLGILDRIPGLE